MTCTVLVPSSLVREAEDKRTATRKVGTVARAAAVFRIDRLVVFPDPSGETGRWDGGFVSTVLEYAATPPYLRKAVWDRRDELEYAGVLPPLRIRPQTGSGPKRSGSFRQGIVTEVGSDDRVRVNCGMQHPISLVVPAGMAVEEGDRVTVRVSSREPVRAKLVDEPPPGYVVERTSVSTALGRDDAGLRIATSRHGECLTAEWLPSILAGCRTAMTVAFGAPDRGLPEMGLAPDAAGEAPDTPIADHRGGDAADGGPDDRFDLWINTIPTQGSEVVRTEEAMFATLAPLSLE